MAKNIFLVPCFAAVTSPIHNRPPNDHFRAQNHTTLPGASDSRVGCCDTRTQLSKRGSHNIRHP